MVFMNEALFYRNRVFRESGFEAAANTETGKML
jgi:hypothetical protein